MQRKFMVEISREAEWIVAEASWFDALNALDAFQFAEREAVYDRLHQRTENMDETGFAFCLRDKKTGKLAYVMDIMLTPGDIDTARDIPEFQEVCEFVVEVEGREKKEAATCTFVEILERIAGIKREFR